MFRGFESIRSKAVVISSIGPEKERRFRKNPMRRQMSQWLRRRRSVLDHASTRLPPPAAREQTSPRRRPKEVATFKT
jgi:hypothetical protein